MKLEFDTELINKELISESLKDTYRFKVSGFMFMPKIYEEEFEELKFDQLMNIKNSKIDINKKLDKDILSSIMSTSSNVFDIETLDNSGILATSMKMSLGVVFNTHLVKMNIKIPQRVQKLKKLLDGFSKEKICVNNIEEINVITNGSTVVAYINEGKPGISFFGQEVRDLYRKTINESNEIFCKSITPCPFREDNYVLLLDCEEDIEDAIEFNGALYFITSIDNTIEEFVTRYIQETRIAMNAYYNCHANSYLIRRYYNHIQYILKIVLDDYNKLIELRWFNMIKKSKLKRKCRKNTLQLYSLITNFESMKYNYEIKREEFLGRVNENKMINKMIKMFEKETALNYDLPINILRNLEFINEEIRNFDNSFTAIIASSLGTLIGAILTLIVTILTN